MYRKIIAFFCVFSLLFSFAAAEEEEVHFGEDDVDITELLNIVQEETVKDKKDSDGAYIMTVTCTGDFTIGDSHHKKKAFNTELVKAHDGDINFEDRDIDQKMLRPYVSLGKKVPCVNINAKDAFELVKSAPASVSIRIEQEETAGESQNVVAEIPGRTDEWIVLTAHYDSTPLSHGAYDNMSGCVGLLGIMEALREKAPLRYGLRFVFCGSEEVGLLGSKAYTAAHEKELGKVALNINLDMIGTYMGRFITCVSAEDKLLHFIEYFCALRGWGLYGRQDVYSSDSTPFADHGVPALSFARIAPKSQATIHNRYDTKTLLSEAQLAEDIDFLTDFTLAMADAVKCPVSREIPDSVKTKLDEYLLRKRRKE